MPGDRKHHTDKFRSCVEKVMADGKDESSAYAICTASLQEAGEAIFEAAAFNEDQPRDERGRWTDIGGGISARTVEFFDENKATDFWKSVKSSTPQRQIVRNELQYDVPKRGMFTVETHEKDWESSPAKEAAKKLRSKTSEKFFRGFSAEENVEDIRHLHLLGATGQVRIEMHDGREHLVVPVVALMEGVIHAVNASTPEFVPASTIAKAASSWNGRPVVLGHPTKDGRQCSANTPSVLASHGIGTIFNSRVEGKKLLCEAWIDKAKAERLHPVMLKRLLANQMEEVSVGAFVVTDAAEGSFNGKPYKATWLETIGDHLAFLPGGRGACSIAMGCGAHRAASHLVTADGFVIQEKKMKIKDRLKALLESFTTPPSVDDLVAAAAKMGDCPMCKGSGNVAGNPCEACDGNGEIKAAAGARNSAKDAELIQDVHDRAMSLGATCDRSNWKTLEGHSEGHLEEHSEEHFHAAGSTCTCGDTAAGGEENMTKTEKIAALLKSEHNPLKDQKALEAADDKSIEVLEAHVKNAAALKAAADQKASDEATRLKAEQDKAKSLEDRVTVMEAALKTAEANQVTPEMRSLVEEKKATDKAQHDALVAQLKAAQKAYTEEELNAKPIVELQKLAQLARVEAPADYSGRGVPLPRHAGENFTPPDPYEAQLKTLKTKEAVN